MTLDHLYALYRFTYHDFDRTGGDDACASRRPSLARAVAEFAQGDAQDGRPLRSLSEFRMALSHGAGALAPLGWRAA